MEINPTAVNAAQASAESSQSQAQEAPEATTATQTDIGEQAAPATQPVKPPQSREDNAAYAELRRRAEKAEREIEEARRQADRIAKYAYDKPYTDVLSELDAADFQQQFTADPRKVIEQQVRQAIDNHPDILAAREQGLIAAYESEAIRFKQAFPEAGIENGQKLRELVESDDDMLKLMATGIGAVNAYRALHFDDIIKARETKTQQETISKLQANAQATPGPVGQAADSPLTISDAELKAPNQARLTSDPKYFAAFREALARKQK